jgi:hypothetical protein
LNITIPTLVIVAVHTLIRPLLLERRTTQIIPCPRYWEHVATHSNPFFHRSIAVSVNLISEPTSSPHSSTSSPKSRLLYIPHPHAVFFPVIHPTL